MRDDGSSIMACAVMYQKHYSFLKQDAKTLYFQSCNLFKLQPSFLGATVRR